MLSAWRAPRRWSLFLLSRGRTVLRLGERGVGSHGGLGDDRRGQSLGGLLGQRAGQLPSGEHGEGRRGGERGVCSFEDWLHARTRRSADRQLRLAASFPPDCGRPPVGTTTPALRKVAGMHIRINPPPIPIILSSVARFIRLLSVRRPDAARSWSRPPTKAGGAHTAESEGEPTGEDTLVHSPTWCWLLPARRAPLWCRPLPRGCRSCCRLIFPRRSSSRATGTRARATIDERSVEERRDARTRL